MQTTSVQELKNTHPPSVPPLLIGSLQRGFLNMKVGTNEAKSSIFTTELMLSSGAITALEWVLEIERDNNVKRNN